LTSTHSADEISLSLNVDNSSVEISADTLQVKALGITNAMLAGSIANAKLVNDSVTINGSSLALGGTLTLDTADFAENGNLFYTDERVDDRINNLFVAGEGIDFTYDDVSNTFTVDAELASASNKGVASFSSDNFLVSTGVVTVTGIDGGTY
jgi:phage baseplate assembly protein gpV